MNPAFLVATSIVLFAALSRFLPHPPNFSPIMALSIFAGAYFSDKRAAFVVPFAAMLISDIFLGLQLISLFVYTSLALGIFIGFLISKKKSVGKVVLASISGSITFFLLTNLGSWFLMPMYQPLSFVSLTECYTLAIPFFRNALIGDLVYCGALFGIYELVSKYVPAVSESAKLSAAE
ncbi:hypothetical protein KAH27_09560 [bacterium]|nr:hypothetical protein [bacterium]